MVVDVIQGRREREGGWLVETEGLGSLDLRMWIFSDSEEERSFGRGGLLVVGDILNCKSCCEERKETV